MKIPQSNKFTTKHVRLKLELHTKLKVIAARKEKTIQSLINEIVEIYIPKYDD